MSLVAYNSKRLIPAPFISLTKEYQRTGDTTEIGSVFRISIQGTIIAFMGSPNSSGTLWDQPGFPPDENIVEDSRLASVIRKIEAIRELFSQDGYIFEVQSADGSPALKCNPRVIDMTFPEGLWNSILTYSITLEADVVYVNGKLIGEDNFTQYIIDASENWQFEVDESPEGINLPRTYRLSHSVSATGKRFYDDSGTLQKPAWMQARDYVLPKLGYNAVNALSSGVNNLPSYYGGYNHVRSSQQDELAGTYSVTENWILTSGKAIEEFECSVKIDQGIGLTSVNINGNIVGLEERNSDSQLLTTKYTNALAKFSQVDSILLIRAQNYSGINLNPITISKLIGKNEINGTISYAYDYDNRPTNLFSGVTLENINISEQRPADLFAVIPVIGRVNGPVLQDLSSKLERTVALSIELAITPPSFGSNSIIDVRSAFYSNPRVTQPIAFNTVIQAARPSLYYSTPYEFVRNQTENWDVKTGRYNYSIEWVFGS